MKCLITYFILSMLTFVDEAWSQGIPFGPPPNFSINCSGPLAPAVIDSPHGYADISDDSFFISLSIDMPITGIGGGATADQFNNLITTPVWIMSKGPNNSLTPVFQITDGTSFGSATILYQQTWQLTDSQASDLEAGLWSVQFDYTTGTDMGTIIPVPEPSSMDLIGGIVTVFIIYIRKRLG
jgi:hypothetical protein